MMQEFSAALSLPVPLLWAGLAGLLSSILWGLLVRARRHNDVPLPRPYPRGDGYRETIEGRIVQALEPVVAPVSQQECAGWVHLKDDSFSDSVNSHISPLAFAIGDKEVELVFRPSRWDSHYRGSWTTGSPVWSTRTKGDTTLLVLSGLIKSNEDFEKGVKDERNSYREGVVKEGDYIAISGRFERATAAQRDDAAYRAEPIDGPTRERWIVTGGEVPTGVKRSRWHVALGFFVPTVFITKGGRNAVYGFLRLSWWFDVGTVLFVTTVTMFLMMNCTYMIVR
jgi:hypothetical protein